MSSYDRWAKEVERELVELGLFHLDAAFTLEENREWFEEQYVAGAGSGVTANEWFTHHHVE